MSRRRKGWIWISGGFVLMFGAFLAMLMASNDSQSEFAKSISFLKGLRPAKDKMFLDGVIYKTMPPIVVEMEEYQVRMPMSTVVGRATRELGVGPMLNATVQKTRRAYYMKGTGALPDFLVSLEELAGGKTRVMLTQYRYANWFDHATKWVPGWFKKEDETYER